MADLADQAQEYVEFFEKHPSRKKEPEAHHTGKCLWCGEHTKNKRWCSPDCRDDWERARGHRRS